MRKEDIVIGGIYTDGKKGIRRVVDIGPQYKLYEGQEDTDCVLSKISARRAAGVQTIPATAVTSNPKPTVLIAWPSSRPGRGWKASFPSRVIGPGGLSLTGTTGILRGWSVNWQTARRPTSQNQL